jgi:hypothetical protein
VDFCACTHRFVGPLAGCHAEHRIYTAHGPGPGAHYTTDIDLFVAYADVDGDGADDAFVAVRERDMAPTDANAREHTELVLVQVVGGALVTRATGAAGRITSATARGRELVLHERGPTSACDVTYAVRGDAITAVSPPCP